MSCTLPEFAPLQSASRPRLLLCNTSIGNLSPLSKLITGKGYAVEVVSITRPIPGRIRAFLSTVDVVLLDITTSGRDVFDTIHELNAIIGIGSLRPRLLCFSSVPRNPNFVLRVQHCGVRYLRVGDAEMLLEAIELHIAEVAHLERTRPCFQIIHRFSQGICSPGEEISAVLLASGGRFVQLRLALAERFVFDFLAQRRLAVDSLQIASGLAGDRFYREHAANSGLRQINKIKRPTVKVLIQRIRDAMASALAEASLDFDPYDILRSCPAEGTNKVLYKLRGEVRWQHI